LSTSRWIVRRSGRAPNSGWKPRRACLVLLPAQAFQLLLELAPVPGGRLGAQPDPGAGLVDEVDRLVRQEPVGDVAVGQLRRRDQRLVGEADLMVGLVPVTQAAQDLDRVGDRGLGHQDGLEPPLERGVLLDVLAVFVDRGGADDVQLTAGQRGLEHVRGADRALRAARPDDGVQLVDEDDQLVAVRPDLVDDLRHPFLEVAPVPGARDHPADVELHKSLVAQRVGHVPVDDALGDALHDRGLADAGLADEHRIVLRPPGQHLDRLLDLVLAADHRVDASLAGQRREIGAVLVDGGGAGRRAPAALAAAADGRLLQCLRGDPRVPQQPARGRLRVDGEREQQVLRADVGAAERLRDLPRVEQRALGRRRQARRLFPRGAAVGAGLDVPGDGAGIGACPRQQAAGRLLPGRRLEQMVGVQVGIAPLRGLGRGIPDQLAGLFGHQLADVDALHRPLGHRAAEEAGEEFVEGTSTEIARPERVVGHAALS
jgi:hypothetical protein